MLGGITGALLAPSLDSLGTRAGVAIGFIPYAAQVKLFVLGTTNDGSRLDLYITNEGNKLALVNHVQVCRPGLDGAFHRKRPDSLRPTSPRGRFYQELERASDSWNNKRLGIDCPAEPGTPEHQALSDLLYESSPDWTLSCPINRPMPTLPLAQGSRAVAAGGSAELSFEAPSGVEILTEEGDGPQVMREVKDAGGRFRPCGVSLGTTEGTIVKLAWCRVDRAQLTDLLNRPGCGYGFWPGPRR